ncbi:MAG: nitrate reductase subunit alpha, partial [Desulfofustis sp.]|nr:nitrate reductase subunit alpha [Desulfofustis sp.]
MAAKECLKRFRFFRPRGADNECREEKTGDDWAVKRCNQRGWEHFYRDRWQYDKKVRTTHGVNCTGSCSWDVYVKNGIIVWETQRTDYPDCGEGFPNHEPRGCPRGATFSWYTYSPVRVKHPLVRSSLLQLWQEALAAHVDPVKAWQSIMTDPEKRRRYQRDRGKGGLVRLSWDEASTIIAASLIHTIQQYGPDRIFGFTPIPAMSMVAYAAGARFLSLIGGSLISFYDWYCDLPPASPQIWGEQTDVPESADWYESTYMIVWGTNLPMTRTPDAHFFTEARYRGARVAAVAPDYAEYVKFADTWLPARAGSDAALAMAMTHV